MTTIKISSNSFRSVLIASAFIVACSTEPKVNELPNTSNPQVEIDRVSSNINMAQEQQIDILSPKNFEAAKHTLDKARDARASNKDQKVVLHNIAVAQAHLDKATVIANVANQLLKGSIEARHDALLAKATKFYPREISEADDYFKRLTEQIEENNTSGVESQHGYIEANYRDIELSSIKKDKLGAAKDTIKESVKEGASKLTPDTLVWANQRYAEDEKAIATNRHDLVAVNNASVDATISANRLHKMVRDAKSSTAKNPEDLAKQTEKNEIAIAKNEKQLDQTEAKLAGTQGRLANASARNEKLESEVWLNREYDKARGEFTAEEAEVYKQGDSLLLRLKGLSFANSRSNITDNNFPLLAKVQKVISDIGSSQIAVEGHTDSIGAKKLNEELSVKRAEAVQSYLIANKNVTSENITASGYGDTKPIATNKTAVGRAQNRRVDIIITAEQAQE